MENQQLIKLQESLLLAPTQSVLNYNLLLSLIFPIKANKNVFGDNLKMDISIFPVKLSQIQFPPFPQFRSNWGTPLKAHKYFAAGS